MTDNVDRSRRHFLAVATAVTVGADIVFVSIKETCYRNMDADVCVIHRCIHAYKKTNLEKIKRAISLIGYDADEIIADKKAHDKLPKCCQNPDFGKPKKE
mgnify:CR=1 FL=1